jgi:hypothetical protein
MDVELRDVRAELGGLPDLRELPIELRGVRVELLIMIMIALTSTHRRQERQLGTAGELRIAGGELAIERDRQVWP